MKFRFLVLAIGAGVLAFTAANINAAPIGYHVQSVVVSELGTLGGPDSMAFDVNNNGDVVGKSRTANMQRRGFIWRNGVMTQLPMPANAIDMFPFGINDNGEVVGEFGSPCFECDTPFYWSEGTGLVTMSRSIHPGEIYDSHYIGQAEAINNAGVIAGHIEPEWMYDGMPDLACYHEVVVTWQNPYVMPQIFECPVLIDGDVGVSDINSAGWIVGRTGGSAVVWKNGVKSFIPKPFAASDVGGYALNDSGVVAGAGTLSGQLRAMWWDGVSATSQWIGTFSSGNWSYANDINEQNFVAGVGDKLVGNLNGLAVRKRAFLWHADFGLYTLPLPAGMPMLSTDCEAVALTNRSIGSGNIMVVGNCGGRAVRWNLIVLKSLPIGGL